jgi:hypothetical protein
LEVNGATVGLAWFRGEHLLTVVRYVQRLLGHRLGVVEVSRLALEDPQVEPSELVAECEGQAFAAGLRELLAMSYLNWAELQAPEHGLTIPVRFEGNSHMGSIILHLDGVDPAVAEAIASELAAECDVEFNFRGKLRGRWERLIAAGEWTEKDR